MQCYTSLFHNFITVPISSGQRTSSCLAGSRPHPRTPPQYPAGISFFLGPAAVSCTGPLRPWCGSPPWNAECSGFSDISFRNCVASLGNGPRRPSVPSRSNCRRFRIYTQLRVHGVYTASKEWAFHPIREANSWGCKLACHRRNPASDHHPRIKASLRLARPPGPPNSWPVSCERD